MRIAISGAHFTGKSTLVENFLAAYPHYHHEVEPYYKLQYELSMELALEPSLDSLLEQLDCSIEQLNEHTDKLDVIFDRCPVDFIAYIHCLAEQEQIDAAEILDEDKLSEIEEALDSLDLIVFLPITKDDAILYTEENPAYRDHVNACFKKIYCDGIYDIFPSYNHPKVIEVSGDPLTRLSILENSM